jgi:hypothetical protein
MPVINEKKIKNFLDTALETIRTEADPRLLNQYRALIRKNVSFFRRSYLAAYLLMLQEQPQGRRGRVEPARQGQRPAQPAAPIALPEGESARLFINIGRNRRVFPREILGLIGTRTSVPKEDIGTISILNNYSFIQVRSSAAPEILEALNGASFRGRTLTVNYARARKEDDGYLPAEPAINLPEEDGAGDGGIGSNAIDFGAYAESGGAGIDDDPGGADINGESGDINISGNGEFSDIGIAGNSGESDFGDTDMDGNFGEGESGDGDSDESGFEDTDVDDKSGETTTG